MLSQKVWPTCHNAVRHNSQLITPFYKPKTFRSQERTVPVPETFRSRGTKVPGNFRSLDLSFLGTFIPRTFRSQELSFLRLFYKALAMNADSYSNCQNLFRSRPSSVCLPNINWVSFRCVRVFFLLNKNAKWINVMMPVDKLTLIRPTSSVLCAVTQLQAHQRQTDGWRKRVDLRTTLAQKFTMESTS